jgi:hypothetical protein
LWEGKKRRQLNYDAPNVVVLQWRKTKIKSFAAVAVAKSSILLPQNPVLNSMLKDTSFKCKTQLSSTRTYHKRRKDDEVPYFALFAFLAQASLQYFFFLSNVM